MVESRGASRRWSENALGEALSKNMSPAHHRVTPKLNAPFRQQQIRHAQVDIGC
jgi:hypothetical protein